VAHNVKRKFDRVPHTNQSVHSRSGFNLEITAIDTEFALGAEVASGDGHFCGDSNSFRNSMQREVPGDLQIVLIVPSCFAADARMPRTAWGFLPRACVLLLSWTNRPVLARCSCERRWPLNHHETDSY